MAKTQIRGTQIVDQDHQWKEAVRLATTAVLPTNTYSNGSAGVGATLTATANAALSVDSVSVSVNDRILVKTESSAVNNGIYTVTQAGDGSHPYILTRAVDSNTPTEVEAGTATFATEGTVNADYGFIQTTTGSITIGTSMLLYVLFHAAGSVSFPLLAPNGSVAAPSYSFTNDSSSGLSFNPADTTQGGLFNSNPTVTLSVGGTAMFVADQVDHRVFTPYQIYAGNGGIGLQVNHNTASNSPTITDETGSTGLGFDGAGTVFLVSNGGTPSISVGPSGTTVNNNITFVNQLLAEDGTNLLPSYAFTNSPSSGVYYNSSNNSIVIASNSDAAAFSNGQIWALDGSASAPSYAFLDANATGFYWTGSPDTINISVTDSKVAGITQAQLLLLNGSVSSPAYSFTSTPDMGFYTDGTSLSLSIGGVDTATFSPGEWNMVGASTFFVLGSASSSFDPIGTSVQPSIVFANDTASGWYSPQNGIWTFGQNGTDIFQIDGGAISVPVNVIQVGPADQSAGYILQFTGGNFTLNSENGGLGQLTFEDNGTFDLNFGSATPATGTFTVNTFNNTAGIVITVDTTTLTEGTDWISDQLQPWTVAKALVAVINTAVASVTATITSQYFDEPVILITAKTPGSAGNSIVITSSNPSAILASGATLAGGDDTIVATTIVNSTNQGFTVTAPVLASNGSTNVPSYSFTNSPSTGMFLLFDGAAVNTTASINFHIVEIIDQSNIRVDSTIGFTVGDTISQTGFIAASNTIATINGDNTITVTTPNAFSFSGPIIRMSTETLNVSKLRLAPGTDTAPSLLFESNQFGATLQGFYFDTSASAITVSGGASFLIDPDSVGNALLFGPSGNNAVMYFDGTNFNIFSHGSADGLFIDSTTGNTGFTQQMLAPVGTDTAPSYSFNGRTDLGFYIDPSNSVIALSATSNLCILPNQALLLGTTGFGSGIYLTFDGTNLTFQPTSTPANIVIEDPIQLIGGNGTSTNPTFSFGGSVGFYYDSGIAAVSLSPIDFNIQPDQNLSFNNGAADFTWNSTNSDFELVIGGSVTAMAFDGTTGGATLGSSISTKVHSITHADSPFTAAAQYIILSNATSGAIIVNLPDATTVNGRTYVIKKTDSSANTVTVTPNGTQKIDGASTYVLTTQYESVTIATDGANWFII